mmetsp:Transcript_18634/g.33725  ORF Transcript_18634/g.33725 Transcript_18634/m.33725 type:complete len:97 (-) Transcript_18634:192-482(-)
MSLVAMVEAPALVLKDRSRWGVGRGLGLSDMTMLRPTRSAMMFVYVVEVGFIILYWTVALQFPLEDGASMRQVKQTEIRVCPRCIMKTPLWLNLSG